VSDPSGVDYGTFSFTAKRVWLAQLAEWALAAVPSGAPALPVNGCFKVTVTPERLCVAASDQQVAVFAEMLAVKARTDGEVFLPARKLKDMLAAAPDGDVTVAVKGAVARVTAGSASWSLRLPPPAGYTGLPDLSGAEFADTARGPLLAALQTVRHSVSKDSGSPAFAQVRIEESGGLMHATAMNNNQMSRAPVPGFPFPVSIPLAALDDLAKLLARNQDETVGVAECGSHVVFRVGTVTLAATRAGRGFPNVEDTFLKPAAGYDQVFRVDRADALKALRRVRINSDASTSAIALIIGEAGGGPSLTVMSKDRDRNSAEEVIPVSGLAGDWDRERLVVVNAGFLEAMLAVYPSPVCEFRLGRDRGNVRSNLLLEDREAKIIGICPQMPPRLMGYEEKS
jgi:DNA polymerase III sliding clamp (beta) subunit (PCNA family)